MKTLLALLALLSSSVFAGEVISIASPYNPSHSGTTALRLVVDEANKQQNKYRFIIEFKPGGQQILAVQHMDQNPQSRLSVIAPSFVENTTNGKLNFESYAPVYSLGDACWAVITNTDLKTAKDLTIGGVGVGNSTHLTALELAEKYKFEVNYVVFKSNFDALILMAGDNSVNLVIDRPSSYEQFKDRNPRMQIQAMSCPTRHPNYPNIKTLREQGILSPYIWNIIVANKEMPISKREELGKILNTATTTVGYAKIHELSDMSPPIFNKISAEAHYKTSIQTVSNLLNKHHKSIDAIKNGK
jgi:tripartite-type tricarboxylate transporter receptor subunit TctC